MGVPLQLILGILLAIARCSNTNPPNVRHIREAPPPSPASPAPIQNVTELNYRDLNKIVKDNPKTETTVDSKLKFVNSVDSYDELPLKLGKNKDEKHNNTKKNKTEEEDESKEDFKKSTTKATKEKQANREDSSRAIDINTSKYWSDEFHSKNVFTISPAPDIEKFQEPPDFAFDSTRHPSFEVHAELTTPTTKIFDQKFKETVESVEQDIEDDTQLAHGRDDGDTEDEQNKGAEIVEDALKTSEIESLEVVKTKAIVNNETINKNSIHKDIDFEQIRKLNYENVFNDTKVYGEETPKPEISKQISTEKTTVSTVSTPTTRKGSLLKELFAETSNTHILSNNIETETTKPVKAVTISTTFSTTEKDKGKFQDIKITAANLSSEVFTTESQTATFTTSSTPRVTTNLIISTVINTTTIPILILNTSKSDQENHVIPIQFGSESTTIQSSPSHTSPTIENPRDLMLEVDDKLNHTVETRLAVDQSTESTTTVVTTTTEIPEATTIFESTTEFSDGTTITSLDDGTTFFVIENSTEISDPTVEMSSTTEEGTTILVDTTTETIYRTSKSLENSNVTEQMVNIIERIATENTTKSIAASTESTVKNELDSTTLNDEVEPVQSKPAGTLIEKVNVSGEITTEEIVPTSSISKIEITTSEITSQSTPVNITTQKVAQISEATTEVRTIVNFTDANSEISASTTERKTTTQREKAQPTTTDYIFVHIEQTETDHTTLRPETFSPNFNYSTTAAVDNEADKIRKDVLDENNSHPWERSNSSPVSVSTTSTTTSSTTSESMVRTVNATTEDGGETSTENDYSKDGGSGGDKGKIAAIAISSVGAVCLVLLAGLLYVMKKRQKRLNYGPRCRPVSLDDYSIDNLSVYNSVRRKGGARMSKRSFGNPAFDDPVAPTHPLNFPALAKFSTNQEDIKAEFEEIPQISARTSELPDGCETKNRYANVIPLPETRVFLQLIDGYPNSDYINANHVTGPKNVKGYYIAAQGPMQNTVDDFWRMIWEQQAKVILMLTHLVENGLEKCVDYLPESEVIDCSRLFGDFQIILKKQEVKDKYIISTLQLKNMVSNSWREVTHFWYLGWPEKGVPVEGNSLIAFLIEARSYMKTATIDKRDALNGIQNGGSQNEHNPVVIHCSPGTGRTGVAIACDIAIRDFETTRLVDIPKIVYRIRRDRAGAVQTKEQYAFIYKVVSLYATKLTGEALEHF